MIEDEKHFCMIVPCMRICVRHTYVILCLLVMFVLMCQVFVICGMHGNWHCTVYIYHGMKKILSAILL